MGFLGLADPEFWGAPLANGEAASDRLLDGEQRGPALDAPARVQLAERRTLPIVAAHCDSYRLMRTLDLRRASVLCATRLESNETGVVLAFDRDALGRQGPRPGPKDKVPNGTGVVLFVLDARARLDIEWRPGTLLLTLLLGGKASNRARVELTAPPRFEDPEVAKFVAANKRAAYPRRVSPPTDALTPLPSYRRAAETPAAPAAPGIALTAPDVVVLGESCVLRGVARLRPRPSEVVRPRPDAPEPELTPDMAWEDPGDPEATAVVGLTLVVVGTDHPEPGVIHVRAPSYTPIPDPLAPPEVELCFALDLFQLARLTEPQASFVYAFAGEAMGGPVRVAMITPESLRGE